MAISAQMVKQLREMTGAGMMDCKKALVETDGDIDKAVDVLREKGLGKAAKKADRLASEGLVSVIVADDNKKATIVEVNSETDFVAKNEQFQKLVKDIALHVQKENIADVDALKQTSINGEPFEAYLNAKIATIGENLVVRRVATIKAQENGIVNGYIHTNGRDGAIIGVKCDKEDTANAIKELVRKICMHAAAMKPMYISYKELDSEFVEKETVALKANIEKENEELKRLGKHEKKVPLYGSRLQLNDAVLEKAKEELEAELKAQNKPEKIWDKIIPGQLERFIADNTQLDQQFTLLSQFYVMDDKKTIEQVIADEAKKLGGTIELSEYVRYELGEGLEKKEEDFAAEVAAQMN